MKRGSMCALLLTAFLWAPPALGHNETGEEHVLLVYNSRVPESQAIRDAYVAIHPGVVEFDLDLDYPLVDTQEDRFEPPGGINNQYITPGRFSQYFGPLSPYRVTLYNNPQIRFIVTTRGLPAVVSDNFDPIAVASTTCVDSIRSSFEAELARPGLPGQGDPWAGVPNPYRRADLPFDQWLDAECAEGGICPGDMYLVCRLDSGPDDQGSHLQGVLDLIQRSQDPTVNVFLATFVTDDPDGGTRFCQTALDFWDAGWCVMADSSTEFIHGANSPLASPLDLEFNEYPLVGLLSLGDHHDVDFGHDESPGISSGYTASNYPRDYVAHPAGLFWSYESFNGWFLHDWQQVCPLGPVDDPCNQGNELPFHFECHQGQVTFWIGQSGGSFTIGNVAEPLNLNVPEFDFLARRMLLEGWTWAEAAYSSLPLLGQYQTPIGDPLARITVLQPDLDGDHDVDDDDEEIVLRGMLRQTPEADINGDGVVDGEDLAIVQAAMGRSCPLDPEPVIVPGSACGDVNLDCLIDEVDLAQIAANHGPCYCSPCPEDLNADGFVDEADEQIVIDKICSVLGDVDGNGCVENDDFDALFLYWNQCLGDPGFEPRADLNCDGCVDIEDLTVLVALLGSCIDCPACPEAACCLADQSCVMLIPDDCEAAGGSPQPPGIDCDDPGFDCVTGACCLPSGGCAVATPEACAAAGGDYQGDGVSCGAVFCDL